MILKTESIEIVRIEITTIVIGMKIVSIVSDVTSAPTIIVVRATNVRAMATVRMTGATVQRKIRTMIIGDVLVPVNINPVVVLQARESTDGVSTRGAGVGTTE